MATYTDNATHLVINYSGTVVGEAASYDAALVIAKADVDIAFTEGNSEHAFIVPATRIRRTA